MQFLKIILLAVAAAIVYGICMDNVTARVCVEYFSIGHPHVIDSESPTDLAFVWGVLATWWAGLIVGVPLAFTARAGARPQLVAGDLVRPLGFLLAAMALVTLVAGITGYWLASHGAIVLAHPLSDWIAPERHIRFLADGAAHLGAYASGFVGGIILWITTWRKRGNLATSLKEHQSPRAV
jgi:hypothetical protein